MARKIGYGRVSTDDQSLDLQIDALKAAGCAAIHTDHGVSGTRRKRSGLDAALADMRPGDTLVVWKLDRLGRSLKFLVDLIEDFEARGCGFVSLTEGFDTTTSTGKLVFQIIAAIAEFERTLAVDRTRAGLAAARRKGKRLGRKPTLSPAAVAKAHRLVTLKRQNINDVARELAVSHDTLRRGFRRHRLAA
ncbi:MAG TPA: recombinase family protein [Novosphingobium sp.]|nr:recombinase family protein [Novosphingobium sp.]